MNLLGLIRGNGDTRRSVSLSEKGDLYVAQAFPPYAELTRQGGGYSAMATAAVAALVVRPTTVAMATLFNNEPTKGGQSLIMEEGFAHNLVASANAAFSIWLCLHPVGMAAPTNDITVRNSHNGRPPRSGAETIFDNGATVVDDGWFPWGVSGATVTVTTPGAVAIAPIYGRLIVPPQAGISLQVVATAAGGTFTAGFRWYEANMKNE